MGISFIYTDTTCRTVLLHLPEVTFHFWIFSLLEGMQLLNQIHMYMYLAIFIMKPMLMFLDP
jgi:hypothetical protein